MNAPFQARAGLRDPFQAFVCDDATADMLRPVAVEHGWSAADQLAHDGDLEPLRGEPAFQEAVTRARDNEARAHAQVRQ